LCYAVPLQDMAGRVDLHFGEAPLFVLFRVRLSDHTIEDQQLLTNPHLEVKKAKGLRVAEWLIGHKIDVILLKEELESKGPAYAFSDAGIEVRQTEAETLSQVRASLQASDDSD
jgi:predicted Fe-Mo cluster-binding NifX family protein